MIQLQGFFVNNHTIGIQIHYVFASCFRIHRDQEIDLLASRDPAIFIGADRKPGRQPCNIGREQVLPADGNSHLENRAH